MATANLKPTVETEIERIERWRREALERAGYAARAAAELALRADIDLHAAIVGARLYHDVTSWNQDALLGNQPGPHPWWGPFAVWRGGLGIWGGILFGVAVGALVVRRGLRAEARRLEEEAAQIHGADEQ